MIRTVLEAHAAACREAMAAGCERPRWVGGSLAMANLLGADLSGVDLLGACLTGADLTRATLTGTNLSGADLLGANLSGADLRWADLTGADLTGADLTGADLSGVRLTRANLTRANLTGARLTEGVARGRAISGESGADRWWAVALVGGGAVLQCGCDRHTLDWWQGLMEAITAAKALTVALGDQE